MCHPKITPVNNASTNLQEKNGFVYTRDIENEEIGNAWFWTTKDKK